MSDQNDLTLNSLSDSKDKEKLNPYHFYPQDAVKYGVNEAIVLYNIRFWIHKNEKSGRNFHEGHYWTYNSVSSFSELFPFFNERQIRYALKSLIKQSVLVVGNFNKQKRDRTTWYTITPPHLTNLSNGAAAIDQINAPPSDKFVTSIRQICQMHLTNLSDHYQILNSDKKTKDIKGSESEVLALVDGPAPTEMSEEGVRALRLLQDFAGNNFQTTNKKLMSKKKGIS